MDDLASRPGGSMFRERVGDLRWRATALTAIALFGALVLVLVSDGRAVRTGAVVLAFGALPVVAVVLGRSVAQRLRSAQARSIVVAVAVAAVPIGLIVAATLDGRRSVVLLVITLVGGSAGVVLIANELRERTGAAGVRAARSPWQQMSAADRVRALPWEAGVGALLIGWSALFDLGVAGPYLAGAGLAWMLLLVPLVGLGALVLVLVPLLVGAAARGDYVRIAEAREDERQRVAAHLHDSVLQTLALVQRQAGNPQTVALLARSQERALRSWMAGEEEIGVSTLAGELHSAVAEVEQDERMKIEVTVLGDRPLDDAGHQLVAATREALRNAARHARGSGATLFAELGEGGAAVYVRDEGDGFDLERVPPARRGIRDSIVGRMAAVGGEATIDSLDGEGTEVALRLGDAMQRPSG